MTTTTIAMLVQFALQYGIPAALKIVDLFKKKDATIEDVRAAFALAHKTYEEYENLPAGGPVQPLPPA